MSIIDRAIELCEKDAETYRVTLPTGDQVEFRHVTGPDEVSRLEQDAKTLIENIRKGHTSQEVLRLGVKDPVTLMQAHFLDVLYVASWRVKPVPQGEPLPKVREYEPEEDRPGFGHWLLMASKVPYAFRTLWSVVDDEISGRAAITRREAVEAAKKGS